MKKVFRKHGTRSMYLGGCRCLECVKADRAYGPEHYRRWIMTPAGQAKLKRERDRQAGIRALRRAAQVIA